MTEIAKKLEVSLAEKEEKRNQLAEKLNSATFQQAEDIKAVIEVNVFVKDNRDFYLIKKVPKFPPFSCVGSFCLGPRKVSAGAGPMRARRRVLAPEKSSQAPGAFTQSKV